jgi:hypothetical protein
MAWGAHIGGGQGGGGARGGGQGQRGGGGGGQEQGSRAEKQVCECLSNIMPAKAWNPHSCGTKLASCCILVSIYGVGTAAAAVRWEPGTEVDASRGCIFSTAMVLLLSYACVTSFSQRQSQQLLLYTHRLCCVSALHRQLLACTTPVAAAVLG